MLLTKKKNFVDFSKTCGNENGIETISDKLPELKSTEPSPALHRYKLGVSNTTSSLWALDIAQQRTDQVSLRSIVSIENLNHLPINSALQSPYDPIF